MIGAINLLNDAKLLCESRVKCDGCSCKPLCEKSLKEIPQEDICGIVGAIDREANLIKAGYRPVNVSKYVKVQRWHPAEGGGYVTGLMTDESDSVVMPEKDVVEYIYKKFLETVKELGFTEEEKVIDDDDDTVKVVSYVGDEYEVSYRYDKGRPTLANFELDRDGYTREDYNVRFVALRYDNGELSDLLEYIPESYCGLHNKPAIYS